MSFASSTGTIRAEDFVVALRCVLGEPPLDRPPSDDVPPYLPKDLAVEGVNPRFLIAWSVAGLPLFSEARIPTLASAIIATRRTLATLAMDAQCGQITGAARLLSTGRTNLRRTLEEAGVYPWADPLDRNPPVTRVAWCSCGGEG